jgi:hypothetical protein
MCDSSAKNLLNSCMSTSSQHLHKQYISGCTCRTGVWSERADICVNESVRVYFPSLRHNKHLLRRTHERQFVYDSWPPSLFTSILFLLWHYARSRRQPQNFDKTIDQNHPALIPSDELYQGHRQHELQVEQSWKFIVSVF